MDTTTTQITAEEKVLVNVRMRKSLQDDIRAAAERLDIPVSQFVRMAVKRQLDEINLRKED